MVLAKPTPGDCLLFWYNLLVYRNISASLIYPKVEKPSQSKAVKKQQKKDKAISEETSLDRRMVWQRKVDVRLIHPEGEMDNLSYLLDSVQLVSDRDYLQERILEQQEMESVVSSVSQCEKDSVLPPLNPQLW